MNCAYKRYASWVPKDMVASQRWPQLDVKMGSLLTSGCEYNIYVLNDTWLLLRDGRYQQVVVNEVPLCL